MSEYKELVEILRDDEFCGKIDFVYDAADAIEQLVAECNRLQSVYDEIDKAHHDTFLMYCKMKHERDAAIADLEKCMHYAKPKNNNVCNFCKKDMSEYPDKCVGWSDFCECEPEWRGAQEMSELDND